LRVAGGLYEMIGDGGLICGARKERTTIESAFEAAHRRGRNGNDRRRMPQMRAKAFAERCCNIAAAIFERQNGAL
jgi:hypothetical protein